jgi:flagellar biosynthesis/type III secretory pathway protein FliH
MPVLLERLGHTTEVTFAVDAALERGDIIVRMADGGVDASLATQLDRLCDALLPSSGAGGREPLP